MNSHPVNQIAQLTDPSTNTTQGFAEGQFHAFDIAALAAREADKAAEGEIFAGGDNDAINCGDSEFEVDDFIMLQSNIRVAAFSGEF